MAGRRLRRTMPTTIISTRPTSSTSMRFANPAPKPRLFASQARPRPAASPPSIAPHGRRGAGGVASRCVTLGDCLPIERPPPRRRAASASKLASARTATREAVHNFIWAPFGGLLSALDSNMEGGDAGREVVIVHMAETRIAHQGLELLLRGMH